MIGPGANAKKKPAKKRSSPKPAAGGNGSKRKPASSKPRAGYDGAKFTKQRRSPQTNTQSEDSVLNVSNRRALVATGRDQRRNFSAAAWAVRKHLDYVSSFAFQARTGNEDLNRRIEDLIRWWSEPANCDIAGRHSLGRMIRIAEASRTIDGDVFLYRLRSGHLQGIESDRVRSMYGIPPEHSSKKIIQGIHVNDWNKALGYFISKRGPHGMGLYFEKYVPAAWIWPVGYYDRYDQVRGVSPMAPAINTFRDLYEVLGYALAKAKVGQLFGLVTYRGDPNALVDHQESSHEDEDGNPRYEIDFGLNPYHLDLDEGDRAEVLESKTPSSEFQSYTQETLALGLKALDIPYSFYNESFTNFSGARQAWLMYDQSAETKRSDLRTLLNSITRWKLAQFLATNLLELPAGMGIRDLRWEWIATGIPWIDPLKEVLADAKALEYGLTSRQRIAKRRGEDFFEIAEELTIENAVLEGGGVPAYGPGKAAPPAPAPAQD